MVGYKQTEVGEIPEDWDVVLLDEIAKRGSGHTPDKKNPEYWNGDIKWISLKDTFRLDNHYIEETVDSITRVGLANSSAVLHSAGTVILSRDAGVGKSAITKYEMAVSQHFIAWKCGKNLDNHFLYYWLQCKKSEFERIAMGSTIKTIGLPYFKKLKIPLPSTFEQSAIASALIDVDVLITKYEELISKKQNIKQGAMQELLTGKRRLGGFLEEWKKYRMKEIGQTFGGLSGKTKSDFEDGCFPYIPFLNIMNNTVIDTNDFGLVYIHPKESQNKTRKGDLFFNGSSETPDDVGMCSLLEEEIPNLYLNSFCFGFRINQNSNMCGLFLVYLFRSNIGRKVLYLLAQGATRYNLSKSQFMQIEIYVPSLEEQQAIAQILSDMDEEILELERKVQKYKQIKQGMMQVLLTGKMRLI